MTEKTTDMTNDKWINIEEAAEYLGVKEFGGIHDEAVLSIQIIFERTKEAIIENRRRKRELEEQQRRMAANAAFNSLSRGGRGRHRRF